MQLDAPLRQPFLALDWTLASRAGCQFWPICTCTGTLACLPAEPCGALCRYTSDSCYTFNTASLLAGNAMRVMHVEMI
jgi:hypothetical protein